MGLTRLFREYALSGEIPTIFIGGNSAGDEVVKKSDLLRAKGEMSTQTSYQVSLSAGVEEVIELDTSTISRNGIVTDVQNNAMSVTNTGIYEIYYGVDIGCDNNEEVSLEISINDAYLNETTIHMEGRGRTKPIPISWKKSINLNAGDVIKMQIVALDTNMTVNVEKSILVVKEDR